MPEENRGPLQEEFRVILGNASGQTVRQVRIGDNGEKETKEGRG